MNKTYRVRIRRITEETILIPAPNVKEARARARETDEDNELIVVLGVELDD